MAESKHLSVTADVWTHTTNTRSFLGATAHYVSNNKFRNIVLALEELDEAHSAEFLQQKLLHVFYRWNIDIPKISAIVTDNGANNVKACELLVDKNKHLPCFAHTLNLVATKICQLESCALLVSSLKSIVTYFKQSVSVAGELRKVSNLKLLASVPTRWNSTFFFMLERFLAIRNEIGTILLK